MNTLFDKMNNEEVSDEVVELLLQFVKLSEAKDWPQAHTVQNTILTTHANAGTNWIMGLKFLVDICKDL